MVLNITQRSGKYRNVRGISMLSNLFDIKFKQVASVQLRKT